MKEIEGIFNVDVWHFFTLNKQIFETVLYKRIFLCRLIDFNGMSIRLGLFYVYR